jgi:lysophospholipase L1-like esterase
MNRRILVAAVLAAAVLWPAWMAAQARRDAPQRTADIVFAGSSSIEYWDLKTSFPDLQTINKGVGGSEITDSIKTEDRDVLAYHPRIVVFYSGDNDIGGGVSPQDVAAHFDQFGGKLHAALPQTRLVVISIKPSLARWSVARQMRQANALIQQHIAASPWIEFVDIQDQMLGSGGTPKPELFVSDGLHMTPAGYRIWTAAVRPHLN